jgi:hypothetical protein
VKRITLACAAFFLLGIGNGCYILIFKEKLDTKIPEISNIGSGQKFFVEQFKDERANTRSKIKLTDSKKKALKVCGENAIGLGSFDDSCIEGESPANMIRKSFCDLLEDAGFEVVKNDGDMEEDGIEVTGTVDEFYIDGTDPGFTNRAWTSISYKLIFKKNGKVVATKRIQAEVSGSPGEGQGVIVRKYLDETLDKILYKTAKYIQSTNFQEDVLGVPPGKVHRVGDSASDPDEKSHGEDIKEDSKSINDEGR